MNRDRGRFGKPALVLCFAVGLVSCGNNVIAPSALQGSAWRLRSMEFGGGAPFVPADPGQFTMTFEGDGRIGLRADCNQCVCSYTLNRERLMCQSLVCTLAACATNRGQEFARIIDGTSHVEIEDGGELEIDSSRGTLVLTR